MKLKYFHIATIDYIYIGKNTLYVPELVIQIIILKLDGIKYVQTQNRLLVVM